MISYPQSLQQNISMKEPGGTVLMPADNAGRYVSQAIESMLAHTFTDFELLIIDDESAEG